MKQLSRWARSHVRQAILLLIFCEVANGFNGVLLGASLLDGLSPDVLVPPVLMLLAGAVWVRYRGKNTAGNRSYNSGRLYLLGAFYGNFLLFMMLGGLWGQELRVPSPARAVWGSERLVIVHADTTIRPVQRENVPPVDSVVTTKEKDQPTASDGKGSQRVGYIFLFLLSIFLSSLSIGLACNIACSGYGFLAVIVLIFGFGILSGGAYFLTRAMDKPLVPVRELPAPHRRRITRRFWIMWAVLSAILLIGLAFG